MPISQTKIEANRRNAQKSTGPKTTKGKQAVSQNAVKHGHYSDHIVIQSATYSEDPACYDILFESLVDELKPVGQLQLHLVKKIANCVWRSQRVIQAETAHINSRMDKSYQNIRSAEQRKRMSAPSGDHDTVELTDEERQRVIATSTGQRAIPSDDVARYILRCEMRLDRQLSRTYALLRQLQNKRETDRIKFKKRHDKEKLPPGVSSVEGEG